MLNKNILYHVHKEGFKEGEIYEAYKIFFGTLVSESRLKIINLLRKEEKSVSEIVDTLKISQPTVSHDLSRLKKCGFVKVKISKNFRHYSLNDKTIEPLMILIDNHMAEYCIHILHEIKRLPKNSLSPQQAEGVFPRIFSLRDQQSLISKLAQQAAGY